MNNGIRHFGPYRITVKGVHAVIQRLDNEPCEPTWYEMQHMKCLAWGSYTRAVEIFPAQDRLYDTRNKRHLWELPVDVAERMPCLLAGTEEWGPAK